MEDPSAHGHFALFVGKLACECLQLIILVIPDVDQTIEIHVFHRIHILSIEVNEKTINLRWSLPVLASR
jgi:hypothetical protein